MHDQRSRLRDGGCIGDRVIEGVDDFDYLQRLAPAAIEAAPEVETPMIDHRCGKLALLRNRMHDVSARHTVGMCRARDVVDIEAGDRRGHDAPIAVDDRMMNQREEQI